MGMLEKIVKKIGLWGTVLGAVFMSAIAIIITATVVGRAVKIALPGTFDLVETLVVMSIAFAPADGQIQDRHLRAEIAIGRLKGRVKSAVESFLGVLNLAYWAILLYAAAVMMADKWGAGEATDILNVPIVPFRGIWVFALILMCLLLLFKLWHHLRNLVKGDGEQLSPVEIGIIGFLALFALLFLGMPIGFCMGLVGFVGMVVLFPFSAAMIKMATVPFQIMSSYTLAVLPLFLFMANIILESGFGADLFKVAAKWLGHRPGGLAMATIMAASGFAACTGSSLATASTMTLVALPEMKKRGYEPKFATGSVCAGGTIGSLLPPSAMFIMYGVLTENSIGTLFMAAIIPAILTAFLYLLTIYLQCLRNPKLGPPMPKAPFRARMAALKDCWEVLSLAVFIFGGILFGFFTATEAGAVGAVTSVVLALARRRLTFRKIISAFTSTMKTTGLIYGIVIGAFIFNYFCAKSTIPAAMGQWAAGLPVPAWVIMSIVVVIYIFLGAIMDEPSIQVLTIPVFYPLLINHLGYDPIWFGVMQVRLLEIGLIAPPVGMVCFVVAGMEKSISLQDVYRGVMPYLYMELVTMPLFMFIPAISLWLPGLMGMR